MLDGPFVPPKVGAIQIAKGQPQARVKRGMIGRIATFDRRIVASDLDAAGAAIRAKYGRGIAGSFHTYSANGCPATAIRSVPSAVSNATRGSAATAAAPIATNNPMTQTTKRAMFINLPISQCRPGRGLAMLAISAIQTKVAHKSPL